VGASCRWCQTWLAFSHGLTQRADWVQEDDLVFPGETGDHLDGSALRRRFVAAYARADLRRSASRICATRSAHSPSAELSRSSSSRPGSATPRCARRRDEHYRERADAAARLSRAFQASGSSLDAALAPVDEASA
jgi:hypothetical protein